MTLLLATVIAVVFGAGVQLLLSRDLIRVVIGVAVTSNSANLFLLSVALGRGQAPVYPLASSQPTSDPLVQALTLTAIVISFGLTAFLLALVYRVFDGHQTLDLEKMLEIEVEEERQLEEEAQP